MKRFIMMAAVAVALTGCGKTSKFTASITGYDRVCVGGISYIQLPSGVSPEYSPDGKLATCR